MNYSGVIIEESLQNTEVLKQLTIVSTKVEPITEEHKTPWLKQWTLHTVAISEEKILAVAGKISSVPDSDDTGKSSWYADFKNDSTHFVIFRDKVFQVNRSNPREYEEVVAYGVSRGIPYYQLDFSPQIKEWERKSMQPIALKRAVNNDLNLQPLPNLIQTERLLLREYLLNDLEDILAYATDPNWSKTLPVPQPYDRQHAIDFINSQLALDRFTHPSFAIEFEGKVVGGVDIRFDFNNCHGDLGYSISPSLWNKGLITEASKRIIDLSFSSYPELRRITANADADNMGSLRVMEKLGMIKEGVLRQHRKTQQKFVHVVHYGILREEWEVHKVRV